jgi:signal transduction histidine kinase
LITGLRIGGETREISALGETEIGAVELGPEKNQIQIEFVALGFSPGEGLRYQYKLEGASEDWSRLADQRIVNFANLAPAHYRFLVRAVNSDGVVSTVPAVVTFRILRPVWQRWWFLSLATLALGALVYAGYRYRVSRLIELERVRTRIAIDLHDDIGAGLSRIAVLSEVARHESGGSPVGERLSVIAGASRELVDSMSDIVWVINPERDQLPDLTQRMRRFASDVFTSRNIDFTFQAPGDERHLKVGADVRRQLLLIFKECVNNIVRHSGCTRAEIDLSIDEGLFVLTVNDNGCGFDPNQGSEGNGLANMRERARTMEGKFHVDSDSEQGTTVTLTVPVRATVKEGNSRLHRSI